MHLPKRYSRRNGKRRKERKKNQSIRKIDLGKPQANVCRYIKTGSFTNFSTHFLFCLAIWVQGLPYDMYICVCMYTCFCMKSTNVNILLPRWWNKNRTLLLLHYNTQTTQTNSYILCCGPNSLVYIRLPRFVVWSV